MLGPLKSGSGIVVQSQCELEMRILATLSQRVAFACKQVVVQVVEIGDGLKRCVLCHPGERLLLDFAQGKPDVAQSAFQSLLFMP